MSTKYSLVAFTPGAALQASELNELQDNFYIEQTLNNTSLLNWFIVFPRRYLIPNITGSNTDIYILGGWSGTFPLKPDQISVELANIDDIHLTMKSGWYRINLPISNIQRWIFLPFDLISSIHIPNIILGIDYYVCTSLSESIIEASPDPSSDGYQFNDNSLGFISSLTGGASRFKATFNEINTFAEANIPSSFSKLCKIKILTTDTGNRLIKIQYPNNYLIKNITI